MLTLRGGNLTYGSKTICIPSRRLFQRLFGHHIKTVCQLLRHIVFHFTVQRQMVACHTTSQHRGVSRKYTPHLRHGIFQIQQPRSRHPFMKLGNNTLAQRSIKTNKTFNHLTGSITEQRWFDIIPLSANGIQFIFFPKRGKNSIFLCNEGRIINQNNNRPTSNIPPSHLNSQPFLGSPHPP